VRLYRLAPNAWQTAVTVHVQQIVTGACTMLYRGMDRAQLDAAYNNTAAVPERDAIVIRMLHCGPTMSWTSGCWRSANDISFAPFDFTPLTAQLPRSARGT
jgi:hypothetical protein